MVQKRFRKDGGPTIYTAEKAEKTSAHDSAVDNRQSDNTMTNDIEKVTWSSTIMKKQTCTEWLDIVFYCQTAQTPNDINQTTSNCCSFLKKKN